MASKTNEISWSIKSKPDWATVSPSTGTGSQQLNISVTPATSDTQEISGVIVIEGDGGQQTSISVTRCVKCTPSTGTPQYSHAGTVDAEACDTSKTVDVPYSVVVTNSDCSTSTTTGQTAVTETFSQNCTNTVQTHTFTYFTVRQAAGPCDDCYTDCDCEPDYGTGTGTAPATGGNVTVTWNYTYPNCSNPRCSNGSVTASIEVDCNSGDERTVTGNHSSYGYYEISQAAGSPEGCGECTCKCSDFSNFEFYSIPANPTGNVPLMSYHFTKGSSGGNPVGHGVLWYIERTNILYDMGDDDWISERNEVGNEIYYTVFIPKSKVKENTSTSERTDNLHIKTYVCTNKYTGQSGYTSVPSTAVCDTINQTITQEGKSVTYCDCYSGITVSPVTASSYSATSATVEWTYTHRKTDGTTETGSSSTTVSFEANDMTSTVTRTGSTAWSNHKLCNGNECGDDAVINWEVSVPGKPYEPAYQDVELFLFASSDQGASCETSIMSITKNPSTSSEFTLVNAGWGGLHASAEALMENETYNIDATITINKQQSCICECENIKQMGHYGMAVCFLPELQAAGIDYTRDFTLSGTQTGSGHYVTQCRMYNAEKNITVNIMLTATPQSGAVDCGACEEM